MSGQAKNWSDVYQFFPDKIKFFIFCFENEHDVFFAGMDPA
jgi:hypothetical protein